MNIPIKDIYAIKPFRKFYEHENYGSDNYGARHAALEYCGLPELYIKIPGMWGHGCIPPWQLICAAYCNNNVSKDVLSFVGRKQEADYLISEGFQARAIGLPFIYTQVPQVQRIKNSLLVMPIHASVGQKFKVYQQDYFENILSLKKDFDLIAVSLNQSSIENGEWLAQLKKHGISYVLGAEMFDENGLKRMKTNMMRFEFMTTSAWGSHIPYALHCGMKVSLWGKTFDRSKEEFLKFKTHNERPHMLDILLSEETENKKLKFLHKQVVHPTQAIQDKELGDWLIGVKHKLNPKELREAFQWNTFNLIKAKAHETLLKVKEYNVKYKINQWLNSKKSTE